MIGDIKLSVSFKSNSKLKVMHEIEFYYIKILEIEQCES